MWFVLIFSPSSIRKRITEIFIEENLNVNLDLSEGLSVRSTYNKHNRGARLYCAFEIVVCPRFYYYCFFKLMTARLKETETSIIVSEVTGIETRK
jgi:hypothetical protein